PPEPSRVRLCVLVEAELDRGDDPEVAPAAAQRPEQVGLVLRIDAAEDAVRSDELDRRDAVRREPVLPREPAHPAAERVADDADVWRGAVKGEQPVLRGRGDDLLPLDARLGARDLGARLDLDA